MNADEILFGLKLDDDNSVVAAKAADGRFLLCCKTAGVDGGGWLTAEQAAGLGLALLAHNLEAAGAVAAASDPESTIELALQLLAAQPEALVARRDLERLLAAPAGSA